MHEDPNEDSHEDARKLPHGDSYGMPLKIPEMIQMGC